MTTNPTNAPRYEIIDSFETRRATATHFSDALFAGIKYFPSQIVSLATCRVVYQILTVQDRINAQAEHDRTA